MNTSFQTVFNFFIFLSFFAPAYSIPNFDKQNYSHNHKNELINIHQKNTYKLINEKSNLKIPQESYKNNFIKKLTKKSYPLKEIESKQQVKDNFFTTFKDNFKDLSSTYVSPFGYPTKRAPDESLKNCQSKQCFE